MAVGSDERVKAGCSPAESPGRHFVEQLRRLHDTPQGAVGPYHHVDGVHTGRDPAPAHLLKEGYGYLWAPQAESSRDEDIAGLDRREHAVGAHGAVGKRGPGELLVARASGEEDIQGRDRGSALRPSSEAGGEEHMVEEVREGARQDGGEHGGEELSASARRE